MNEARSYRTPGQVGIGQSRFSRRPRHYRRRMPSSTMMLFVLLLVRSSSFSVRCAFSTAVPAYRRFYQVSSLLDLKQDIEYVSQQAKESVEIATDVIGGKIQIESFKPLNGVKLPPVSAIPLPINGAMKPVNGVKLPQPVLYPPAVRADETDPSAPAEAAASTRSMWRRRNARSAEEGIRREKTTQLSTLLTKVSSKLASVQSADAPSPRYAARTITGLINALAEEADDLEVQVDARRDTPLWGKHVDAVRIQFSRLGFKPLRMGGLLNAAEDSIHRIFPDTSVGAFTVGRQLTDLSCADEAFERIDVDNSGALDTDEIAEALTMAASAATGAATNDLKHNLEFLRNLASELVALYDFNGDGVVDRGEYQSMVEDMAALREEQELQEREQERQKNEQQPFHGWFNSVSSFVSNMLWRKEEGADSAVSAADSVILNDGVALNPTSVESDAVPAHSLKPLGSITFSDLKLDLRRLLFGAIPIIKHLTPGGPLILEPFTATVTGSFNQDDIMNSHLLDAGLRRLVAQALKRRVRSLRDFMDGAIFHGRSWKMSSKTAPSVQVLELTNVEFDDQNKLILTGRVRVRARQELPFIENSFKLRTKIGTRRDGRFIRLVEPELALVLECPQAFEENIVKLYSIFGLDPPSRPEPIFSFFPLYSPFKLDDNDGFDLGEDNCIKSIYIEDKALRFELSAVLRPGRFLGNHYLAFTVPNRTFIITLDRVKEGIKAARKAKRAARALVEAARRNQRWRSRKPRSSRFYALRSALGSGGSGGGSGGAGPNAGRRPQPKSFFSRFVDGYLQAERDGDTLTSSERVTTAIRDFFGRQGQSRRASGSASTGFPGQAPTSRDPLATLSSKGINGDSRNIDLPFAPN